MHLSYILNISGSFIVQINDAKVVRNNYPYTRNSDGKYFEDKDLKNEITN